MVPYAQERAPPAPRPLPAGHFLQILKHGSLVAFFETVHAKYGPVVLVWMGMRPIVSVIDADAARWARAGQAAPHSTHTACLSAERPPPPCAPSHCRCRCHLRPAPVLCWHAFATSS